MLELERETAEQWISTQEALFTRDAWSWLSSMDRFRERAYFRRVSIPLYICSMLKISNVSKLTDWVRHLLLVHPRYLIYVTQLINNPQMKPHKYSLYIKSVTMNPVPGFNKARYGWTLSIHTSASITASWCCRCCPRLCYTLANAA